MTIGGSFDLSYYHTLEVVFTDVFFVKSFFQGWQSSTLEIPKNEIELNIKYEIETDNQLFIFKTDDYENDVIIAAHSISFNTDTVFYYNRENLKEKERIAHFVKP